jgi:hypothetical protein
LILPPDEEISQESISGQIDKNSNDSNKDDNQK